MRGVSLNQLIIESLGAEIDRVRADDDFTGASKAAARTRSGDPGPPRPVTRYLSLAEFWYLAEHVTGIEARTLIKASRVDLADSALHTPAAEFPSTLPISLPSPRSPSWRSW